NANGNAAISAAVCSASKPPPPLTKRTEAVPAINKPQIIFNLKAGFNEPPEVMDPSTKAAESAEVIKKSPMTATANKLEIIESGNCSSIANNVSSTSFAAISASGKRPANSIFNAVPPKVENQTIASTDGTTNTPMMNSLIVLPFEILAINRPT